jgi:ABC-type sugar transport system permease subunit
MRFFKSVKFETFLMLPAIMVIAFVMVYPTLYALYLSLFDWKLGKDKSFIGFKNYINIFAVPDITHSLWITTLFTVIVVVIAIILGLLFAKLLNMGLVGSNFALALLLVPWAIPPITNGILWFWIMNPRFGTFNNLLINIGILKEFIVWFQRPWPAFMIIVAATVYKVLPLTVFLLSASLKTIPKSLYEAADIDGASDINSFFSITIPLIRPVLVVIFILLSVYTFKAFDMIYAITKGGPANFTAMLNYVSYIITFRNMNFGLGAAVAFLVSFIILIISIFYYKLIYSEVKYE